MSPAGLALLALWSGALTVLGLAAALAARRSGGKPPAVAYLVLAQLCAFLWALLRLSGVL